MMVICGTPHPKLKLFARKEHSFSSTLLVLGIWETVYSNIKGFSPPRINTTAKGCEYRWNLDVASEWLWQEKMVRGDVVVVRTKSLASTLTKTREAAKGPHMITWSYHKRLTGQHTCTKYNPYLVAVQQHSVLPTLCYPVLWPVATVCKHQTWSSLLPLASVSLNTHVVHWNMCIPDSLLILDKYYSLKNLCLISKI